MVITSRRKMTFLISHGSFFSETFFRVVIFNKVRSKESIEALVEEGFEMFEYVG